MADDNQRPIIIKRKKVISGGGHHGGAWKVAYADFVTAMMAFFLLMWLLNATTESQRKGIADYFAPTIPISPISGGGNGLMAGDTVFAEDTLERNGTGGKAASEKADEATEDAAKGIEGQDLDAQSAAAGLDSLEAQLLGKSGESEVADDLLSHIVTRVTDEGLVIDIFAKEGRPLFASGSDEPTPKMMAILAMVAEVAGLVSNGIAVAGHTDAEPFTSGTANNWSLSADRAEASRRVLGSEGIEPSRFVRITGKADRDLALPSLPRDPRNRRVTITLLRSDRT